MRVERGATLAVEGAEAAAEVVRSRAHNAYEQAAPEMGRLAVKAGDAAAKAGPGVQIAAGKGVTGGARVAELILTGGVVAVEVGAGVAVEGLKQVEALGERMQEVQENAASASAHVKRRAVETGQALHRQTSGVFEQTRTSPTVAADLSTVHAADRAEAEDESGEEDTEANPANRAEHPAHQPKVPRFYHVKDGLAKHKPGQHQRAGGLPGERPGHS